MPRSTQPKRTARRSEPGVETWLDRGEPVRAYESLRSGDPSAVPPDVRKRAYLEAGRRFADHGRSEDLRRVSADAAEFATDAAFARRFAAVCAYGGALADARSLIRDDHPDATAATADVLMAAADRAVRTRSSADLPAEFHAGFDAILTAAAAYDAGDDERLRVALEGIGARSPFREWKLFFRGLSAHASGDAGRAAENWKRLNPARLPARLAAPLRTDVGPDSQDRVTAAARQQLASQAESPLVRALADIRAEFAGDNPLTKAFRLVDKVLRTLTATAPDLVPRLANAFYTAILAQGEPRDLDRFRKAFGPPPDDPDFARLEGMIYEQAGDLEMSNRRWDAYAKWLAGPPDGWPAELAARVRAIVYTRMAGNAAAFDDPGARTFPPSRDPKPAKSRTRNPSMDAAGLLKNAATLAPDWDVPAEKLFALHVEEGRAKEAESVAHAFLKHHPNHLPTLDRLATLYAKAGRADDARIARFTALAANPLDRHARGTAAASVLLTARRRLIDGRPDDALAALDEHAELVRELSPMTDRGLRSVVARKLGHAEQADALRDEAFAIKPFPLTAAYQMCVDSGLAKLKPADKRAADQRFAQALAEPGTGPADWLSAYSSCRRCEAEGIDYRGRKTHLKKLVDLAPKTITADAPAVEFEQMVMTLVASGEWKAADNVAGLLGQRFRDNPVFPLARVEAEIARSKGSPAPYRVLADIEEAKKRAEASPEARHRDLLDRINELHRAMNPGFMFDLIFGR